MLRRSARRISLACKYRPTTIPPLPRPVAHGRQLASPTTYACPPQPHCSRGLTSPHRNMMALAKTRRILNLSSEDAAALEWLTAHRLHPPYLAFLGFSISFYGPGGYRSVSSGWHLVMRCGVGEGCQPSSPLA